MGLKPSPLGQPHNLKFRKKKNRDTKREVKNMENYRKSSHCTYDIKYHLVWITKYRKPVITGKIAVRTRELIRTICQRNDVEILAGHVGIDHIHMLVSVPPYLSASKLVQYIKGATSRKLQMEYKELNKQFWGQHLWARGYFVASSGNVTDEIIKEYIQNQDLQENTKTDNFEIS
jgi:putative transposase